MSAAGNAVKPGNEVIEAAQWLADKHPWTDGLRREIRDRFSLDSHDIAEAVEMARKMQVVRKAFS